MKIGWLKYFALPFAIRRGYKINELLRHSQNSISENCYLEALNTSKKAVELGKDRFYEARMFEGLALYYLERREASASAFAKAIRLFEKDKNMSMADKNYLYLYCYSFFKDGGWPKSLKRPPTFPNLARLSEVSAELSKKFPFQDYPPET